VESREDKVLLFNGVLSGRYDRVANLCQYIFDQAFFIKVGNPLVIGRRSVSHKGTKRTKIFLSKTGFVFFVP
jgi:hypothetical protein